MVGVKFHIKSRSAIVWNNICECYYTFHLICQEFREPLSQFLSIIVNVFVENRNIIK